MKEPKLKISPVQGKPRTWLYTYSRSLSDLVNTLSYPKKYWPPGLLPYPTVPRCQQSLWTRSGEVNFNLKVLRVWGNMWKRILGLRRDFKLILLRSLCDWLTLAQSLPHWLRALSSQNHLENPWYFWWPEFESEDHTMSRYNLWFIKYGGNGWSLGH